MHDVKMMNTEYIIVVIHMPCMKIGRSPYKPGKSQHMLHHARLTPPPYPAMRWIDRQDDMASRLALPKWTMHDEDADALLQMTSTDQTSFNPTRWIMKGSSLMLPVFSSLAYGGHDEDVSGAGAYIPVWGRRKMEGLGKLKEKQTTQHHQTSPERHQIKTRYGWYYIKKSYQDRVH